MAPRKDATKPAGEWNPGSVLCDGTVIEHWLNGKRVLSFDYADPKWAWHVELLGIRGGDLTGRGGRLWLQDHGQDVWFRNLRWRELGKDEVAAADPTFEPMPVTGEALAMEEAHVARMDAHGPAGEGSAPESRVDHGRRPRLGRCRLLRPVADSYPESRTSRRLARNRNRDQEKRAGHQERGEALLPLPAHLRDPRSAEARSPLRRKKYGGRPGATT